MINVFIDIETIPSPVPPTREELSPPKTIKKPESIEKWKDENAVAVWRKEALQPERGRVWLVSLAVEDGEVETFVNDETVTGSDDSDGLWHGLANRILELKEEYGQINFIAHNVRFDRSFLFIHYMKEGDPDMVRIFAGNAGDKFTCTMKMFMPFEWNYRISLNKALKALGLWSHKEKADGSMVFDMWQSGQVEKAIEYCEDDVVAVRSLFNKLKIQLSK